MHRGSSLEFDCNGRKADFVMGAIRLIRQFFLKLALPVLEGLDALRVDNVQKDWLSAGTRKPTEFFATCMHRRPLASYCVSDRSIMQRKEKRGGLASCFSPSANAMFGFSFSDGEMHRPRKFACEKDPATRLLRY